MIRFNCPHCNRFYELSPALALLPLVCKQCGERLTPPAAEPDPPPAPKPAPLPPPVWADPQAAPAPARPFIPPKPAVPAAQVVPPPAKPAPPKPAPKPPLPPADDEDEDDGVLITKPDMTTPDIDFNVGGPTAASLSDANRPRPAGLSDANRPRPNLEPTDADINLDLLGPAPVPKPKPAPKMPEPEPPEPKPEPTLLPFVADLVVFVVLIGVGMFVGEMVAQKSTGVVLSELASPKFPPIDLMLWGGPPAVLGLLYILLGSRKRTVGEWLRRRHRTA